MAINAVFEILSLALLLPVLSFSVSPDSADAGGLSRVMSYVTDLLPPGSPAETLLFLAALLFAVFSLKTVLVTASTFAQHYIVAAIRADMTSRLLAAYARSPYEDFLYVNSAHAVYDIAVVAPSIVSGILQPFLGIVLESLIVLGVLCALVLVEPTGTLVAAGVLSGAFGLYYVLIRKPAHRLGGALVVTMKEITSWSHLAIGVTKENRILGREGYFIDRVAELSIRYARMSAVIGLIGQLPRHIGEFVIMTALLATIAYLTATGTGLQSHLAVLGVFAAGAFRVLPSGNRIVNYASDVRRHIVPFENIRDELRRASDTSVVRNAAAQTEDVPLPFRNELRIEGISYRYRDRDEWAIRGADLSVQKGQTIAFVGPSGAGKTTLFDMLMGLLPLAEGRVLMDGVPLDLESRDWRSHIGYVPQNIFLADDTLYHNITLGLPESEIDPGRVATAVTLAQLDSVIADQAQGVHTMVGERGVRISGGQRQRIGVARALYSDPDVLFLDEATSSLDWETERAITDAILRLRGQKTIFLIAHRLGTIRMADRIFFIRDGRIVDDGTFAELAERHEFFRDQEVIHDSLSAD